MEKKDFLVNEDLYLENIKDYEDKDLKQVFRPDKVGVASSTIDGVREYTVYSTDERGSVDFTEKKVNFDDAINTARGHYKGLLGYYRTMVMDHANIKKRKR